LLFFGHFKKSLYIIKFKITKYLKMAEEEQAPQVETVEEVTIEQVEPQEGEDVIVKQYASAFFGTSLVATLNGMGVDTLIITGCTTSGCIRATAVDTVQHGFRPICVRECIGDRAEDPHEANLFDINAKYGDVISKEQAMSYLNSL
jgi:maleamate amidohydrolase